MNAKKKRPSAPAAKTSRLLTPAATMRPLAPADLDAVVAIDAVLVGRTRRAYFERRLNAALRQPKLHLQFAAESDGRLAGYALGRVLEGEFGRTQPGLRLEVISVARELGLSVPEELAVVGYDNSHDCDLVQHSLSSIDQSGQVLGLQSARLLVERIAREVDEELKK